MSKKCTFEQLEQAVNEKEREIKNLKENELRYKTVFEQSSDAILIIDPENQKAIEFNERAASMLGYSMEEFTRLQISDYEASETAQELNRHAKKILEKGEDVFETQVITKDSQVRDICVNVRVIEIDGRKFFYSIFRDFTEQKQTEEALKESHEQLITVINNLDAAVYIADMETYELLFVNKQVQKIFDGGDIIGKQCWKILQKDMTGPCAFCTNSKLVTANGKPTGVHNWEFQNTINGRWYDCRDQAIKWTNGCMVRLEIATDVTDRKRMEAILSDNEKKFRDISRMLRLMCDNVPDMIWAKDFDKRYTFVNKSICAGLLNASDPSEPIGKTDMFFADRERALHPDDPYWHTFGEICWDSDDIVMETGVPGQFEEYGNVKEVPFLDVHKAPFYNEQGEMIGTVGSARDVTKKKRLRKHCGKANIGYGQS